MDPGPSQHPGRGRAVLACIEVSGAGDPLGGGGDVRVVEHDHRCLPAQLEVHPFEVGSGGGATSMPARTLPVIETMAGVGCSTNARPVSGRRRRR